MMNLHTAVERVKNVLIECPYLGEVEYCRWSKDFKRLERALNAGDGRDIKRVKEELKVVC